MTSGNSSPLTSRYQCCRSFDFRRPQLVLIPIPGTIANRINRVSAMAARLAATRSSASSARHRLPEKRALDFVSSTDLEKGQFSLRIAEIR